MPTVQIRAVPDAIVAALKRRAKANRRSLQAELRAVLAAAASRAPPETPDPPMVWVLSDVAAPGGWGRDERYEDDP